MYTYIYIYIYVGHKYACIHVKNAKSSAELTIWLIKCWSDNIRTCINMHINIQVHTYGECAIFRWATLIRRYEIVWFAYHTYVYVYAYVYVYKYTRICAYVYGLQPMCNSTCKFWSLPLCCTYHLLQCWICIYVYVYIYIYIRVNHVTNTKPAVEPIVVPHYDTMCHYVKNTFSSTIESVLYIWKHSLYHIMIRCANMWRTVFYSTTKSVLYTRLHHLMIRVWYCIWWCKYMHIACGVRVNMCICIYEYVYMCILLQPAAEQHS